MYASGNPRTKKQLKEMVASGRKVRAFQPGGMFEGKTDGRATIKGPHYPEAHKWYASVDLVDGIIVKVRS